MHVVVICRNIRSRGAVANVALRQAGELAKHFDVTIISDDEPETAVPGVAVSRIAPRNYRFLRRFAHVPNELAFARAARLRLAELETAAFVLCHGHVNAVVAALPLQRSRGLPFGIVTHGDIFERPPGTYDWRLTTLYKWATPIAYRHSDLIVALSPAMADLARLRGARDSAIEVIPNGVDPADLGLDLRAAEKRPGARPVRLLYVGRLAVEKGVDVLIEACRAMTVEYELRIVGNGPLERKLRESAAGLPIEFTGPLSRRELGAIYATADVTCVPSISDPFPGVVLESMAAGTPVVGTRVGGIPSVVSDGVNGVLVPPADAGALARAIETLGRDRSRLLQMSIEARSTARRFSWEEVGGRLAEAIGSLVRRHR